MSFRWRLAHTLTALLLVLIVCQHSAQAIRSLPFGLSAETSSTNQQPLPSSNVKAQNGVIDADICIVGGGLAGLALFCGIATHLPDSKVVLIEKRNTYDKSGATLGLAANGKKAINELLNDDTFVQTKIYPHGKDMEPLENLPVHVLPWWIVRDALLNKANELVAGTASAKIPTMTRIVDCNCGMGWI